MHARRPQSLAAASLAALAVLGLAAPPEAAADTFEAGSLIIPMDTDTQDLGIFEAYGLVYELLMNGVPVRWVIKTGKAKGDADFTVAASDLRTMADLGSHGYRGGPWVIDSADVDDALPIVEAWLDQSPNINVHEASADFQGDVSRLLVVAPTIAMMADGNQKIARKYMMAAKIPDSTLDYGWPDSSPDMLDPDELAGPDDNVHHDGALFDEDGDPVYCQFMSMHWGVGEAEKNPSAVAEVREFLTHPTHFFAECQAVNAFENLDPHGFFLTAKGFLIGDQPKDYDFFQADEPFNQLDGDFLSVGGSEPAYTLPPGEMYKASDIVMITEAGTPTGTNDVWMTGFLDGVCPASKGCLTAGKVSYLGGHEYSTDVPISANPDAQGTRLFLNSLFEAPCATVDGLPVITLTKSAPAQIEQSDLTFTIDYKNEGPTPALAAVLRDPLPTGSTFVEASMGGVLEGDEVRWDLGNLGVGEGGQVTFTVQLGELGEYQNVASLDYNVGLSSFTADSNKTLTLYGVGNELSSGGDADSNTGGATSGDTAGTGSGSASASGGESTGASTSAATGSATGGASDTATGSASAGESVDGGCGCRSGEGTSFGLLVVVGPLLLRRRRRGAASARA